MTNVKHVIDLTNDDEDEDEFHIIGKGKQSIIVQINDNVVHKIYRHRSNRIRKQYETMLSFVKSGYVPEVYILHKDGYTMQYLKGYDTLLKFLKDYKKNKSIIERVFPAVIQARFELGKDISIPDMSEQNTLVKLEDDGTISVKFIDITDIDDHMDGYRYDLTTKIFNLIKGFNKYIKQAFKEHEKHYN